MHVQRISNHMHNLALVIEMLVLLFTYRPVTSIPKVGLTLHMNTVHLVYNLCELLLTTVVLDILDTSSSRSLPASDTDAILPNLQETQIKQTNTKISSHKFDIHVKMCFNFFTSNYPNVCFCCLFVCLLFVCFCFPSWKWAQNWEQIKHNQQ